MTRSYLTVVNTTDKKRTKKFENINKKLKIEMLPRKRTDTRLLNNQISSSTPAYIKTNPCHVTEHKHVNCGIS